MWNKLDSFPIPVDDVVGRNVEGEAVLISPQEGQVKVLNEVGARVWELADGTRTVREIASKICAEYQVDQTGAEVDVVDFVELMMDHGLIELSDKPAETATGNHLSRS